MRAHPVAAASSFALTFALWATRVGDRSVRLA